MSIKLALLKSGDNIIADIKELISEEKVCGYLFNKPHVVEYTVPAPVVLSEDKDYKQPVTRDLQVALVPWILFTEEEKVPVRSDWIVTIVEPTLAVKEMYEEKVNVQSNQTDNSDEPTNLSE
tara:strand:+ start:67 stop:432 length:366 start_codon:yes stop_codon:yes gene_type:complete